MKNKNIHSWTNLKLILSIMGLCGLLGLFLFTVYSRQKKEELIENYGKQTVGIIYDKGFVYKRKIVNYKFWVKGKVYTGSTIYYDSDGEINIGDQFVISYYPDDPEINKIEFDKGIQK